MSMFAILRPVAVAEVPEKHFLVVHPLDDVRETKIDTSTLGVMPMTASVKASLMALRGYLIVMMLLLLYHVLDLAGVFARHTH
jgi:hypothetical protein